MSTFKKCYREIILFCFVMLEGVHFSWAQEDPVKGHIYIPVHASMPYLEKSFNDRYGGLLYDDSSYDGDNVKMKIWKNGHFKMSFSKGYFHIKAPIHVWLSGRYKKRIKFGFGSKEITLTKDTNFAADIYLKIKAQIDSKWNLQSQTEIVGVSWSKKPQIKIGPIKISIGGRMESLIKNHGYVIDKVIGKIKIRQQVKKLWLKLQNYYKVYAKDKYALWLRAFPESLKISPFSVYTEDGVGYLTTYLQLFTDVELNDDEKSHDHHKVSLPYQEVFHGEYENKDTELYGKGRLNLRVIEKVFQDKFAKQTYQFKVLENLIELSYKKLTLYHESEKIFLKINFAVVSDENKDLEIILEGVPYVNEENFHLSFKKFDYSLETTSELIRFLDLKLHSYIQNHLAQRLNFNFISKFQDKEDFFQHLFVTELKKNIHLETRLQDISLSPLNFQDEEMSFDFSIKALGKVFIGKY